MIPLPSAALPAALPLASLASLLGPAAILAVIAVIATLVVVVAGLMMEQRDAAVFQRLHEASAGSVTTTASRSAA